MSDFKVGIGLGNCTDIDVKENEISCAPPDRLPEGSFTPPSRRRKRALPSASALVIVGAIIKWLFHV